MSNPYQNTRIEYHILQSFPVSCLNRDDVGAPKSAVVGGQNRARVSSQCWKRAIRMAMHDLGIKIAVRTRKVVSMITQACLEKGATEEQAAECGLVAAGAITKINKGESGVVFYISYAEANSLAEYFQTKKFEVKDADKEMIKRMKAGVNTQMDGLDIALFGRMAASAPVVNIEAATSFAHAISTHKVASEVEFFTAVDDFVDQGTAHMGSLEYNSATYYRYVSLDLGKLYENLCGPEDLNTAIDAFTKALFIAVPTARQTTMAAAPMWDYAKILVRKGYRLQASFEKAVRAEPGQSILEASTDALKKQIERFEKCAGSLYGKQAEFEFDGNCSIDEIVEGIKAAAQNAAQAK